MKINPGSYYKRFYKYMRGYDIYYTGTKWVYSIAYKKYDDKPLVKYGRKFNIGTIKELQHDIDDYSVKIEEISKEDLFLEML